jgi:hypothetical protein
MFHFADIIFQPPIQEISSIEQLNQSLVDFYTIVVKGDVNLAYLIEGGNSWVDVRDLGLAHALALERGLAGGERIIISAGKSRFCCIDVVGSLLITF